MNSPLLILFIAGLGPELEELMVEGFLLQVTLPETEQLYRYLLYKLAPQPSNSAPCGNNTEEEQESQRGSPQHIKVMTIYGLWIIFSITLYLTSVVFGVFIVIFLSQRRMEFPVSRRRWWTVRAKGPSDVRKAPTRSTARRPRSSAKRSPRKAKREVKKPRGLVLPHTQCLTLLLRIQRRTTHCVLHHGAESPRATRFVYYVYFIQGLRHPIWVLTDLCSNVQYTKW